MTLIRTTSLLGAMVLAGLFSLSFSANAVTVNVCKTTGAKGETKYTQIVSAANPQSSCKGEVIGFRSDGRQDTPGQMAAPTVNPNEIVEDSRAKQLEQQLKEMEAREQAQRCQTLKNSLANLNLGGRVYEMDASGNRVYLNAQEIETRRSRTQQTIAQFCNGG